LIIGEIQKASLISVRNRMPIFQHRRKDLYAFAEENKE